LKSLTFSDYVYFQYYSRVNIELLKVASIRVSLFGEEFSAEQFALGYFGFAEAGNTVQPPKKDFADFLLPPLATSVLKIKTKKYTI
jgi:hypothetical protein